MVNNEYVLVVLSVAVMGTAVAFPSLNNTLRGLSSSYYQQQPSRMTELNNRRMKYDHNGNWRDEEDIIIADNDFEEEEADRVFDSVEDEEDFDGFFDNNEDKIFNSGKQFDSNAADTFFNGDIVSESQNLEGCDNDDEDECFDSGLVENLDDDDDNVIVSRRQNFAGHDDEDEVLLDDTFEYILESDAVDDYFLANDDDGETLSMENDNGVMDQDVNKGLKERNDDTPTPPPSDPPVMLTDTPVASTLSSSWETIIFDGFEDKDSTIFTNARTNLNRKYDGRESALIKETQLLKSRWIRNITNYSLLEVTFYFQPVGFDEDGEGFVLEYKFNGTEWLTLTRWIVGEALPDATADDNSHQWIGTRSKIMQTNGEKRVKFRLRGMGNERTDRVFIDNVEVSGKVIKPLKIST